MDGAGAQRTASRRSGLAWWLAQRIGCTAPEAEARLLASRRAAWLMTASPEALAADAQYHALEAQ